jgi:NADH:ubiquinone oxidoreductase subunit B-like Fe-S oxidoreductase
VEERGIGVGLSNTAESVADVELSVEGQSLQKKGFVVSSVDNVMNWARTGSMWPMTFGWPVVQSK